MIQLSPEERDLFPITFCTVSDIRTADRIATFWEASGLDVQVVQEKNAFTVILKLPVEAGE